MDSNKNIKILIAEDDDGHADLIREALEESGVKDPIIRFKNGELCLEFFENELNNGFDAAASDHGFLLLLDINMPRMDGVEVLRKIKCNPKLKGVPVIMLTTTDDPREIEQCYEIGCNVYITKPVDFHKFSETLKRLGLFVQIIHI